MQQTKDEIKILFEFISNPVISYSCTLLWKYSCVFLMIKLKGNRKKDCMYFIFTSGQKLYEVVRGTSFFGNQSQNQKSLKRWKNCIQREFWRRWCTLS